MPKNNGFNIEQLSLSAACDELQKIDPELASIILDWNPSRNKFKFYKTRYYYGKKILERGKLQLPLLNGMTIAYDDLSVPAQLKEEFSYSSFPVGIILNNTAEVFVEFETKIVSLAIFERGVPLGLLESLETENSFCFQNVWTVTAGSRTAFMSPKISDKFLHSKLQRAFGCNDSPPRMPSKHFDVFVDIMQKTGEQKEWYVDLLFFAGDWFKPNKKDLNWLRFHHYCQDYLLKYTGFSRNKPTLDLMWHYFLQALNKKKKRINAVIYEMLKNVIAGAMGVFPLFSPANDNSRAPVDKIQRVYRDVYGLQYAPTIMVPRHFGFDKNSLPVYFSLKQQNTLELNPKSKESESLIADLVQLHSLLKDFLEMTNDGKLGIENTIIECMIKAIHFDFYHINSQDYYNINDTKKLFETDSMLVRQLGFNDDLDFAYTSSFFRSCIQIYKKSNIEINRIVNVIN